MGGKPITLLADAVASYVKACGKRSILECKPQNLKGINLSELKFAPKAEQDVVEIGYSRLKRVFTTGQNYKNYEQIVSSAKNKIVGNIPKELIDIILKNHPEKKAELIKQMQYAFGETVDILKKIQLEQVNLYKCPLGNSIAEKMISITESGISERLLSLRQNYINEAVSTLQQKLCSIIPGAKVEIKYIGAGQVGDAYKLIIKNKNSEKIIADRVLKVYRSPEIKGSVVFERGQALYNMRREATENDLVEVAQKLYPNSNIKKARKNLDGMFPSSSYSSETLSKFIETFKLYEEYAQTGLNAEANILTRLKNILGHNLSKTDCVNVDLFDLEHGYALSHYADKMLPKPTSFVVFEKLGLRHYDAGLPNQAGNRVNGRIIDYGGIRAIKPELLDKTVLKYYKKIINRNNPEERKEVIIRLQELADNPKTPFREKIIRAIEIAQASS